ncbi:hypothetical protein [Streptomyces sp. NBC_00986]|uniref:hypothetical protein n=1 Tax=Streptomyces sp. NBC_00986 TaxID=2903702 RepID=UPI003866CE2E|nr:hypothetical protein OG504_39245 [Streptomyces sp. NBC_00986]
MGQITGEMREKYGHQADWIPPGIVARIDEDEILDRLDQAADYWKKAESAPADLARGYMDMGRIICQAAPRDETEQQAQEWMVKAADAHTSVHAAACITKAHEIRQANPPAPRRVRYRPSPEQLAKAQAVAVLQADIVKAAIAKQARQAEEDRNYQDALAGRRQWTIGDQVRYQRENGS